MYLFDIIFYNLNCFINKSCLRQILKRENPTISMVTLFVGFFIMLLYNKKELSINFSVVILHNKKCNIKKFTMQAGKNNAYTGKFIVCTYQILDSIIRVVSDETQLMIF